MLEKFIEMVKQADMLGKYDVEDCTFEYEGEEVGGVLVKVYTDELGSYIAALFHKGTELLVDMNINKVCSCHKH